MVPGILGKKIGMSQIFTEDGVRVPVTVLEAGPCSVQAIKTKEKDGYDSVQMGYDNTKEHRLKKPQRAYIKAKKLKPMKFVREIRCEGDPEVKIGDVITNKIVQNGDYLDITGVSKGKGFQGGMKRWGWSGGKQTHGSMSHRAPGSIGQSSNPSRVFKGMGMAGHMGSQTKTVQNLRVLDVNTENNTISVEGSVPGANGTYLVIRYAKKKPLAERVQQEEPEAEQQEQQPEAATQKQQEKKEEKAQPQEDNKGGKEKEQTKEGNEDKK
ncbi:MAG: 50S ribosomal protein L3 [Candidatus Omnitrophica bacterium]|nr:50S ribosomal protein L3 [Candidatus Omnitrophota bacterium]